MKILFLTRKFYPSIGGVERHSFEVARELVKRGNRVVVISEELSTPIPSPSEESLRAASEVFPWLAYRIPVSKNEKLKKFQIWEWLFRNINLIKEAEVVHCHDVFFWYLPFRFLFPAKPIFITFHGWEGKFPVPRRYILARKIWEKLSWGNICVGDYLKKWYGVKSNFVTYGGIEGVERVEGSEEKEGKIVFVGRLEKDVGLLTYLKLLEELKKKKINLKVEFYGDGTLRKEAEKYGKVFGFVQDILPKIKAADFVFASSYLAILEALSLRKAVISTWDNPLKEDYLLLSPFKDLIISDSDTEKLAEKVTNLLENQKIREKLTERGYRWAREQTWEKVVDLYLRLWKLRNPYVSS